MKPGYICGHEGTGLISEVGDKVKNFKKGDHVVVPFLVSWCVSKSCLYDPRTSC